MDSEEKHDSVRAGGELKLLIFCTLLGAISSVRGGELAVFRGAVLGLFLALPLIIIHKRTLQKGHFSCFDAGFLGLGFGVLGGVVMILLELIFSINPGRSSVYQQAQSSLVIFTGLYGFVIHFIYSANQYMRLKKFDLWLLLYLAFSLCYTIRIGYELLPSHMLKLFFAAAGNSFFFMAFWGYSLLRCSPIQHEVREKFSQKLRTTLFTLRVLTPVVIFLGINVIQEAAIHIGDWKAEIKHNNPQVMAELSGILLTPDKRYLNLSDSKIAKDKLDKIMAARDGQGELYVILNYSDTEAELYQRSDDKLLHTFKGYFVEAKISPSGNKIAFLECESSDLQQYNSDELCRLVVFNIQTGKKLIETKELFLNRGLAWTQDEDKVICVKKDHGLNRLCEVNLSSKMQVLLTEGSWPVLSIANNQILFYNNSWIMSYDLDSKQLKKLIDLSEFIDENRIYLVRIFLRNKVLCVSPDGKWLIVKVPSKNLRSSRFYYLMVYNLENPQKSHLLDKGFLRRKPLIWLSD